MSVSPPVISTPGIVRHGGGILRVSGDDRPEPLNLQDWIAIDEPNHAFTGASWSGYMLKINFRTMDDVMNDGGPDHHYDPDDRCRGPYRKVWGI
jgi:hypothetical protein